MMQANPTAWFDRGQKVDAYNFTLEDFTIYGLARAFAKINRFAGAGDEMKVVSDAQHQVNLSYLVPPHLAKAALIHEIPELFIGDVPSPIKRVCPELGKIEDRIQRQSSYVFKIPFEHFEELHPFDKAIAYDEARYLFPDAENIPAGLGLTVVGMTMEAATIAWVMRFEELF